MRRLIIVLVALLVPTVSLGCVKKSAFDAKLAELEQCKGFFGRCQKDMNESQAMAGLVGRKATELQAGLESRTKQANTDLDDLQKQLDESAALNQSLRAELERMGANVDKLMQEKGAMSSSLDSLKARLEELRNAQAAAERRAEAMRQLVERFRKMADAGRLKVVIRRGRMVLQLPNDVLFDSGKAIIKKEGKATLVEIANILKTIPNRQLQIAGHTDNEPIRSSSYPSNWYLSTSRAIKVVEVLVQEGVRPQNVSACGYGEFDPIVANNSVENKAKNRRIEIVAQPNVDELLAIGNR